MASDDEKNQAKADATFAEYCEDRDKGFDDGRAAHPYGPYERNALRDDGTLVTEQNFGGPGMTLLDHFAGLAMVAHIVAATTKAESTEEFTEILHDTPECAYVMAAAMIEEKRRLEKGDTDAT